MAKKHVLIDIRPLLTDHVSGVTVYLEGLLKNLSYDNTFRYSLYCNSAVQKDFVELEKSFPIHYTRYPNKILNLAISKWGIPKIDQLIGEKVDIFLAPDLRPTALSKTVKKIQILHDFSWLKHPEFFSTKTKLWFKLMNPKKEIFNSDYLVTPSESIKKECDKYVKNEIPVTAIGPFLQAEKTRNGGQKRENKTFFFIGTLEPRKNLSMALRAFAEIHKKDPATKFIIAGGKDEKVFQRTYGIGDNAQHNQPGVRYLGRISEEEKKEQIKKARCLVYLSHYEGFGLPVAEAIMAKTPCLISQDPALKETAGAAGLAVNANNIKDVVEGMEKILYDEESYKTLQENCYHQSKQWDNQKTLEKWLNIFQLLLKTDTR